VIPVYPPSHFNFSGFFRLLNCACQYLLGDITFLMAMYAGAGTILNKPGINSVSFKFYIGYSAAGAITFRKVLQRIGYLPVSQENGQRTIMLHSRQCAMYQLVIRNV
jgi:hypothetical protein